MKQLPAYIILAIALLAVLHTGNTIASGTRYHETVSTDNIAQTKEQSSDTGVHMTARTPKGVPRTKDTPGQSGIHTQRNVRDENKVVQRYLKSAEGAGKAKHAH